ncbi:Protein transport protein got1-like protein [Diplonema papillatum]|nr:Protein transport protein got1-like protein [Diplonema papillatum]
MDIFGATENQKIGIMLSLIGVLFMFMGVILLLDSTLLTMGNVMFLTGLVMTVGKSRTQSFFFDRKRFRPSVFFFSGVFLVLYGWVLIGLLLESFGAVNLFGNFVPLAYRVMKSMPVIGHLLSMPLMQDLAYKAGLDTLPS